MVGRLQNSIGQLFTIPEPAGTRVQMPGPAQHFPGKFLVTGE
jgi:hypothetical protein